MNVTSFAPGKVILSGEHSVVYGHPAIAMAINLGVSITLRDSSGRSRCNQSKIDHRLWDAMLEVVPEEGVEVELESNLPIGKGMGSSAALSIALIRAIAKREQNSLEQELELDIVLRGTFTEHPWT